MLSKKKRLVVMISYIKIIKYICPMLGPKLLRGLSSQSTIPATEEQLAAAKASRVMGGCVYLDVPCTTIQCTHVDLSTLKFTIYIYIYTSGSAVSECSTSTSTGWLITPARSSLALKLFLIQLCF